MKDSIFSEFQYFIRRINDYRRGMGLNNGETIEDLEQRFRVQVERGLVIIDPNSQEVAMEILLSDLSEQVKKNHLITLRQTGKCSFKMKNKAPGAIKCKSRLTLEQKREKALDLFVGALKKAGLKVQRQPLGVKMLMAEFDLKNMNYDDADDLKLLFVSTIKLSGHAKKVDAIQLAKIFNGIQQ